MGIDNKKNLQNVYNTLKNEGYTPPEYDVFEKEMEDENNLKGVYETLKKEGYTPPEYDVFMSDMGFGKPLETEVKASEQAEEKGFFGNLWDQLSERGKKKSIKRTIGPFSADQFASDEEVRETTINRLEREGEVRGVGPFLSSPKVGQNDTFTETMQHIRNQERIGNDDRFYRVSKTPKNLSKYAGRQKKNNIGETREDTFVNTWKNMQGDSSQEESLYDKVTRHGFLGHDFMKALYDENARPRFEIEGKEISETKSDKEMFSELMMRPDFAEAVYDALKSKGENVGDKAKFMRDYNGQGDTYAETMAAIEEDARNDIGKSITNAVATQMDTVEKGIKTSVEGRNKSAKDVLAPFTGGGDAKLSLKVSQASDDERMYYVAKRTLEDSQKLIEAAEADKLSTNNLSGFLGGAARGLKDGVFDISTWDFGLTDLKTMSLMQKAIEKADNNEQLTQAEQALLDAKATEAVVASYFSQYLGRGYKAGKVTGESLPFMVEMAINPLAGTGKTAQAAFARYIMKRFGRQAAKNMGTRGLTRLAGSAVRVGGDVAGAAGMSLTTGMPGVLADTKQRQIGEVNPNIEFNGANATISYDGTEGGKDFGTAFREAATARTIENHSEMFENYLAPFLGTVGRVLGKTADWSIKKLGSDFSLTKFLKNMNSSEGALALQHFADKTNWHGTIPEFLGEMESNLANAYLVGDQSLNPNDDNYVFSRDNVIDTYLGVALMGGAFSLGKTVSYRTEHYNAEKAVNRAHDKLSLMMGGSEKFSQIASAFESKDEEKINGVLAGVHLDDDLTNEQKAAILDYAGKTMRLKGIEDAIEERKKQREEEQAVQEQQAAQEAAVESAVEAEEEEENIRKSVPNPLYDAGRKMTDEEIVANMDNMKALDEQLNQMGLTEQLNAIKQSIANNDGRMTDPALQMMIEQTEDATARKALQDYYDLSASMSGATNSAQDVYEERKADISNLAQQCEMLEDGSVHSLVWNDEVYLVNGQSDANMYSAFNVKTGIGAAVPVSSAREDGYRTVDEITDMVYGGELAEREAELKGLLGLDENGNPIVTEQPTQEEQNPVEQPAEQPAEQPTEQPQPETALSHIPKDKNGNTLFEQAENADVAWDALLEMTEGDAARAQSVAKSMLSDAKKELEKLEKGKAKDGKTVEEKLSAEKNHVSAIDAAKKKVAMWEEIAGTEQRRNGLDDTTGQEEADRTGFIKKKLSKEEALSLLSWMENNAEVAPEVELTIENWDSLFGKNGDVSTPIGEVKMGENQFIKLMRQGRDGKLGMISPTLSNPDVIIEDSSSAKDGDTTERASSYVFVKSFVKPDGSRYYYGSAEKCSWWGKAIIVMQNCVANQ